MAIDLLSNTGDICTQYEWMYINEIPTVHFALVFPKGSNYTEPFRVIVSELIEEYFRLKSKIAQLSDVCKQYFFPPEEIFRCFFRVLLPYYDTLQIKYKAFDMRRIPDTLLIMSALYAIAFVVLGIEILCTRRAKTPEDSTSAEEMHFALKLPNTFDAQEMLLMIKRSYGDDAVMLLEG